MEFRHECFVAIKRGISLNPILHSFQEVVNRFAIEHQLIEQFLDSMEMDLSEQHYTTEKYEKYILGSAQVVGLMCLRVFTSGVNDDYHRLKIPAMKLGSAFQKINFLRDINVDYNSLSRSYFPELEVSDFDDENKKVIEQDIRRDFEDALIGIKELPKSSRMGVYLAYLYYKRLFNKVSKVPAERILSERIRVPNSQKFLIMIEAYLCNKLNWL